jgi:molecular chaperone IbpA
VIVTDAALSDGLLSISLKRELPEALKPRTIAINTGDTQPGAAPLIEGEKVKGSKAA